MKFVPILSIAILDLVALLKIPQGTQIVSGQPHKLMIECSNHSPAINLRSSQCLRSRPEVSQAPSRRDTLERNLILVRVTFYYPNCDRFGTKSATGERLKPWKTAAVDPAKISYGSKIIIPNLGEFMAHDTGTDVINRKAARLSGKTIEQKAAIVIDICVKNEREMEKLSRSFPMFAKIILE